jgi:hypothetical protein
MSVNSIVEHRIVTELEMGRNALLNNESLSSLLSVIQNMIQLSTTNLYIIRWIPSQGEDIYDVLIDGTTVACVEIPRLESLDKVIFNKYTLKEYLQKKTKMKARERQTIHVARDLAMRRIESKETNKP